MTSRRRRLSPPALAALLGLLALLILLPTLSNRARQRRDLAARVRLLRSLAPDLRRLEAYETAAAGLRQQGRTPGGSMAGLLPENFLPPERKSLRRLTPVGGWIGLQAELAWPRLATTHAFALLAHAGAARPPWRAAKLRLEALPERGAVRLEVVFESAEPEVADE